MNCSVTVSASKTVLILGVICIVAIIPRFASALQIDNSQYTDSQLPVVWCNTTNDHVALYDTTASNENGPYYVSSYECGNPAFLPFTGTSGHSYSLLEVPDGVDCAIYDYNGCKANGSFSGEALFTVGDTTVPNSGAPALTQIHINNTQYIQGDTATVYCEFTNDHVALFDITPGSTDLLSQYPCGVPTAVSIDGIVGHQYSLVEIWENVDCAAYDYEGCKGNNTFRGEALFTIGNTAISSGDSSAPPNGLSKSSFGQGEGINAVCKFSDDALSLYDISPGINGIVGNGGFLGRFPCGSPILFDGVIGDSYALLEVGTAADCAAYDYADCKTNSYFVAEYNFSIYDRELADLAKKSGVISYPPQVEVLTPKTGDIFSHTGIITYKASDKNDTADADQKTKLGLTATPISIYYTDKIGDWDHSYIKPEDKVLIAKDLPNTGSYTWNIKDGDLLTNHPYRIIVEAIDASDQLTPMVSDFFTVDLTAPQFTVSTDPSATRGEDVTVIVDANKDLKAAPIVTVTQQGGSPITVTMKGGKSHYEGVYKVIPGEDGVAAVQVEGTDLAGNIGATIVSGGTFAVGINPPPKPKILFPTNNMITSSSTISMRGSTRPDTTIVLKVNGVDAYTATTSADGTFTIPKIALSKATNRGVNILSVAAKDKAGSMSEAVPISVKFNISPTISLSTPASGATLSANVSLDAKAADENGDVLHYTYQIIAAKDLTPAIASSTLNGSTTASSAWTTIGEDLPVSHFSWDSTEAEDGEYYLRAIVDDGTAQVVSVPVDFHIKNTLPFFRFEDGRKTLTGTSSAVITGRVLTPDAISPRPTITKIEYSLDSGKHWKNVAILSGAGTSEARFSVMISGLQEGTQAILWRVKDSRALFGRASHPVIVDSTAPSAPVLISPHTGAVVGDDADEDKTTAGLQTEIRGEAEAGSAVTLTGLGITQTVKANIDGAFIFRNVTLTRGAHDYALTATDEAGNVSEATRASVIYDNAPEISFLEPKPSRGLKGISKVSWRVSDSDEDPVRIVSLSYRRGSGAFAELPVTPSADSISWDVSSFPQAGDYELRLIATDGIATTTETAGFFIDDTPPSLDSFTLSSDAIGKSGTLTGSGTASDSLSGIEYVEYAITPYPVDSGIKKEWYTGLLTKGYLRKSATFSIKSPVALSDGTYEIAVRAVDAAGNISSESTQEIRVDTTPPRVGSFTAFLGGMQISPDKDGALEAYEDTDLAIGVSLEDDTASAELSSEGKHYPLTHDLVTGLWSGPVHLAQSGEILLEISATDKLGNSIQDEPLGKVATVTHGKVLIQNGDALEPLSGAHIRIFQANQDTGHFDPVTPEIAVQENGSYESILRAGSYKLVLIEKGYRTVEHDILINQPTLVHESFTTEKISTLQQFVQSVTDYFRYSI